jgi:chromosome partitioning protein
MNEKGGSGKTTLVANLAAYLALKKQRRVLVVDMDPQGQLGKVLGIDVRRQRHSSIELLLDSVLGARHSAPAEPAPLSGKLPSLPTRIPNLDAIVANKSLALFPTWTGIGEDDPTLRLSEALRRAPEVHDYDYVFFDAPPSFGPLTLNVLRACDEVAIPVPLTFLALDGSAELMRTIETVRTRYAHRNLTVTMVIPTFYRRTRLAHEILDRLRQRFPTTLSQTVVGYHVKIDEAQSRGLSIFEYAPSDRGAKLMAALANELEERRPELSAPERPAPGANP